MIIVKDIIKKHFNKNFFMYLEDEKKFQPIDECWMCNELFTKEDKKVTDHDHTAGKYRGSAHQNCNINLKLPKKVSVIFHNLKGYESHLIKQEIDKFDVKLSVIRNGSEKHMDFRINKNLVFIGTMHFMNSNLALLRNLSNNEFKYLSQDFT